MKYKILEQVESPPRLEGAVTSLVDLSHNNHSRALTEQVVRLALWMGYHQAECEMARSQSYAAVERSTSVPPGLRPGEWKGSIV